MCIAQLLSPADMVGVGAGLTHEDGDLFSIVLYQCLYGRSSRRREAANFSSLLFFFGASGYGVKAR
jgi:hypothetical protein